MTETRKDYYLQCLKKEKNNDILFQIIQKLLEKELEEKFNIPEIDYDDRGRSIRLSTDYANLVYCIKYDDGELMFGHIPHKHVQIKNYLKFKYDLDYLGKFNYNTGYDRSCVKTFVKFKCKDYNELREALLKGYSIHELRNSQK